MYRDDKMIQRWNEDGSENVPEPYNLKEFHLLPTEEGYNYGLRPFSLFLTRSQKLIYRKRRHVDTGAFGETREDTESVVYVLGFEESIETAHFSSFAMLLPDGRIEWTYNFNHDTVYDRCLQTNPPKIHELWGSQWEKDNE
jgi:hypothetical protein